MTKEPERTEQDQSEAVRLHSTSYDLFILFLTIYSLIVMVLLLVPWLSEAARTTLLFIDTIICIIFLGDFLSNLRRSGSKSQYFFRGGGWLDLLGSIPAIPIFRLARLARLARILRFMRGEDRQDIIDEFLANRAQSTLFVTILIAIVVLSISAIFVLQVESRSDEANITTGGDAFWWAFVTITTVGYGDYYPTTLTGRIMAMILMTLGIAIFGVLASFLSTVFIAQEEEEMSDEMIELHGMLSSLQRDNTEIKNQLQALRQALQDEKTPD
ncbi:MAG: ion transporter [Chloroflexota bacterium]|nr:MAG: ion transporter [Chloroflexota bacterium]